MVFGRSIITTIAPQAPIYFIKNPMSYHIYHNIICQKKGQDHKKCVVCVHSEEQFYAIISMKHIRKNINTVIQFLYESGCAYTGFLWGQKIFTFVSKA